MKVTTSQRNSSTRIKIHWIQLLVMSRIGPQKVNWGRGHCSRNTQIGRFSLKVCSAVIQQETTPIRLRHNRSQMVVLYSSPRPFIPAPVTPHTSYGNQFYDSCSVTPRPSTLFSSYYGCDVSLDATAVYSLGFLAGTIPLLNFSINAFGAGSVLKLSMFEHDIYNIMVTNSYVKQTLNLL